MADAEGFPKTVWQVIGGGAKGGVQIPVGDEEFAFLPNGSFLEETEKIGLGGKMIRFRLLCGKGPEEGFVEIKDNRGTEILTKAGEIQHTGLDKAQALEAQQTMLAFMGSKECQDKLDELEAKAKGKDGVFKEERFETMKSGMLMTRLYPGLCKNFGLEMPWGPQVVFASISMHLLFDLEMSENWVTMEKYLRAKVRLQSAVEQWEKLRDCNLSAAPKEDQSTSEQIWEVVGGGKAGGIMVREGRALASKEVDGRLSTGAIVREVGLEGERLRFHRLTGTGPTTGWVSLSLKGNELVRKFTGNLKDLKAAIDLVSGGTGGT